MSTIRLLGATLALLLVLPAQAEGTECTDDADCPAGEWCLLQPGACGCPDCDPDDAECEPCDCEPGPEVGTCVAEERDEPGQWIASECATDADCPLSFRCQAVELGCDADVSCPPCTCTDCAEGDPECEPDCECPPCDEPEPCDPDTVQLCVFAPVGCSADTDCEAGFSCIEQQVCWSDCACGGCVCPDCPDGEDCPPCDCPEEPVCECEDDAPECESLGAFCVPQQIGCADDTDCPAGWTCDAFAAAPCACPGCDSEGGDCPPCDCEEQDPQRYCLPAGWSDAGFGDGDSLGSEDFLDQGVDDAAGEHDRTGDADVDGDVDLDADGDADPEGPGAGADPADGDLDSTLQCGAAAGPPSGLALLLLGLALRRYRRRR